MLFFHLFYCRLIQVRLYIQTLFQLVRKPVKHYIVLSLASQTKQVKKANPTDKLIQPTGTSVTQDNKYQHNLLNGLLQCTIKSVIALEKYSVSFPVSNHTNVHKCSPSILS